MQNLFLLVLLFTELVEAKQAVNITSFKRIVTDRTRRSENANELMLEISIAADTEKTVLVSGLKLSRRVMSTKTTEANNATESKTYKNLETGSLFVDGINVQLGSISLDNNEVLEFEFIMHPYSASAVLLNKSEIGMPLGSCGVDHKHEIGLADNGRSRRLYTDTGSRDFDAWFGNNACYPEDNDVHQTDVAIAVGYFAYLRWGSNSQTVADHVTYIMHKTNEVFSRQANFFFKVEHLQISTTYKQYPYDASSNQTHKCSSTISDQLEELATYSDDNINPNKHTFWHLIDDCDYEKIIKGSGSRIVGLAYLFYPTDHACLDRSHQAVSYVLSPFVYEENGALNIQNFVDGRTTWTTVAHEFGHGLGLPHPWLNNSALQGSFGGLMDYGTKYVNQESSNSKLISFLTNKSKTIVCSTLSNYKTQCPSKLKKAADSDVACGNLKLDDPAEECECSDGSQSCWRCHQCKWQNNFSCSNETLFYESCRCNDQLGVRVDCHGICLPDGSCQQDNGLCKTHGSGSLPCYLFPGNPCKMVCSDPKTTPPSCHNQEFLNDNAACFLHNKWGSCDRNTTVNGHEKTCNVDKPPDLTSPSTASNSLSKSEKLQIIIGSSVGGGLLLFLLILCACKNCKETTKTTPEYENLIEL